jgi:hypothetical protein
MKIYKNGVFINSKNISMLDGIPLVMFPIFAIGAYGVVSSLSTAPNLAYPRFNGTIDEVAIWNRALSSDEISAMYNSSVQGNIRLQTKVSSNITLTGANWSDYYIANGSVQNLVNLISPYRYLQYRTLFDTLDTNVTPVLTDVAVKQVDYKVRIFNTAPYGNFSLLYPYNNSWINNNLTTFNLTNGSDLDRDTILFSLLIYNSTNTSILYLQNKTYNNYTLSSVEQLRDGNYTWKVKLFDNSTVYDDIYENRYSSWSSYNYFQIDTTAPNITLIQILANASGTVI